VPPGHIFGLRAPYSVQKYPSGQIVHSVLAKGAYHPSRQIVGGIELSRH